VIPVVTGIASLIWHALLALLWRVHPAFARWPFVLVPVLIAIVLTVIVAWLLRRCVATRDWDDRHRLALVSASVVSHSIFGGAVITKTAVDRACVAVLVFVTIVLLILFACRVRDRTRRRVEESVGAKISRLPAGAGAEERSAAGD
jgi:hypothetical protein